MNGNLLDPIFNRVYIIVCDHLLNRKIIKTVNAILLIYLTHVGPILEYINSKLFTFTEIFVEQNSHNKRKQASFFPYKTE